MTAGEVVDSVGGKEALSAKARSGKRVKNGSQSLDRSKAATTATAAATTAASDGVHDLTDGQTVSDTGDGLVDIEDLVPLEVTMLPLVPPVGICLLGASGGDHDAFSTSCWCLSSWCLWR